MSAIDVALPLIKYWERCRLTAYKPVPDDPWTIGWGATGPNITEDTVWTQQEADSDLINRVILLQGQITDLIKVPTTNHQLGAFIDFCYNVGIGNFRNSTLLKLFNEGAILAAGEEFPKWDKAHGITLRGLHDRRLAEQTIYYMGDSV